MLPLKIAIHVVGAAKTTSLEVRRRLAERVTDFVTFAGGLSLVGQGGNRRSVAAAELAKGKLAEVVELVVCDGHG